VLSEASVSKHEMWLDLIKYISVPGHLPCMVLCVAPLATLLPMLVASIIFEKLATLFLNSFS